MQIQPEKRHARRPARAAAIIALLFLALNTPVQPAAAPSQAVIEQYCIDCHDAAMNEGGLDFDAVDVNNPAADPALWENVLVKLLHRRMPPEGKRRPDEAAYDGMIAHLAASIDRAAATHPNPGRTDTFRRLTRTEYRNAIRDLLDLDIEVKSLLPKDDLSHGFDNIAAGGLSPTLLERYLAAAKKIAALAIGRPLAAPGSEIIAVPLDLTQESHLDGLPFGTRGGAAVRHNFPLDAEYELQLRLTRNRNEKVEGLNQPHVLELLLDGAFVHRFTVKPPGGKENHDKVDRHMNVRIPVTAGPHTLGAVFVRKTAALIESDRQPYLAHFNADRHARTQPALYSISVIGPYNATGPGDTPSRRRIFADHPAGASGEDGSAKTIISTLMRRAYRRPVTDGDLEAPLRFYQEAKEQEGFEAGIEMALRAILVSPHFLFRIEAVPADAPANAPYRVPGVQLASRLSFFLWSSIPDDELLDKAIEGQLGNPQVLARQVRRMLADKRSTALVNNFAAQWLYLRNLEAAYPAPRLFLDFDDNLRQAMRRETELFFESILREDRGVLDFLRADYTFVNERLAKHYGISNIYGSRFRRIQLAANSMRGGLLAQASILTVTSYATRTSPVLRGKWILDNILGTPPKPPLPEAPPLKEKSEPGALPSMRARIAQHREDKVCASCHNMIDPLGLALENYDAIGRWRTEDEGAPIDATGRLADGSAFDGAAELQRAILNRPELFVATVAKKLLTYALGRGLEHYDAPAVRKIVNDARQDDYRFSSLILGIVNSTPFQMRNAE